MEDISTESALLEAFLFAEGEPVKIGRVADFLGCPRERVPEVITHLKNNIEERSSGLSLIITDTEVSFATAPIAAEKMEAMQKKALEKDIGPAGLEVLAVLLYKGPSTRAGIDYIRGVNSSFTIRNLLTRQLIERVKNPHDAREYVYRPTSHLLAHLGIESASALPDYADIRSALASFEKTGEPVETNDYDDE